MEPARAQRDEEAVTEFASAVEINSNFVDGHYGLKLSPRP
jgi:hypothetical protein